MLHEGKVIEMEVPTILKSLDITKAAAVDNISPKCSGAVHYLYSNQSKFLLSLVGWWDSGMVG